MGSAQQGLMVTPTFDAESLITEFGSEALIAELAELLLSQADGQLAAVHLAIAGGDGAALKAAAHKIKGGMGTFGAATVTRLAAELESLGRDNRLAGAHAVASQLDAAVRALCNGAKAWLDRRAA